MSNGMPKILVREMQRALTTLKTAGEYGVKYRVEWPEKGMVTNIAEPAVAAATVRTSRPRDFRYSQLYIPILKATNAGDVKELPIGDLDYNILRGAAAGWCSRNWGRNTYTVATDLSKGVIEVYRYK